MRVDVTRKSGTFEAILHDPSQMIFLDANLLIAPDRSCVGLKAMPFDKYQKAWLDPFFDAFDHLAIHESVYHELQEGGSRRYADEMIGAKPTRLRLYKDDDLTADESAIMRTYIDRISEYTQYHPEQDNAKDRGEVLSLSYIATKGFLYFATNDEGPIRLVEAAERQETVLQGISIVYLYEILYYLQRSGKYDATGLKMMYKYHYFATPKEKKKNPAWGEFIEKMNLLYQR